MAQLIALLSIVPLAATHGGDATLPRTEAPFTVADACTVSLSDDVPAEYIVIETIGADAHITPDGHRMYSSAIGGVLSPAKYFSSQVPIVAVTSWDRSGKRLTTDELVSRLTGKCRALMVRRNISPHDSAILGYLDSEILLIRVDMPRSGG